jgi:hypothetical protein
MLLIAKEFWPDDILGETTPALSALVASILFFSNATLGAALDKIAR